MPDLVAWRTEERSVEGGRPPRCWLSVGWGRIFGPGPGMVFKTLFRLEEQEARKDLGLEARDFPTEPAVVRLILKRPKS